MNIATLLYCYIVVNMEEERYLKLGSIGAYKVSFCLSNYVWDLVVRWDHFTKSTIGSQFVRAVDSISANVAEGFGRYGKKDKINFYRYSSGSVKEALDWNEKARVRNLLSLESYQYIFKELSKLPREINYLIKFTREKLSD